MFKARSVLRSFKIILLLYYLFICVHVWICLCVFMCMCVSAHVMIRQQLVGVSSCLSPLGSQISTQNISLGSKYPLILLSQNFKIWSVVVWMGNASPETHIFENIFSTLFSEVMKSLISEASMEEMSYRTWALKFYTWTLFSCLLLALRLQI